MKKNVKNVKKRFLHLSRANVRKPARIGLRVDRHTVARLAGFFASTVPLLAASHACTPAFSYNGAI